MGLAKGALVMKAVYLAPHLSHIYLPCWLSFILNNDSAFSIFSLLTHFTHRTKIVIHT